MLLGYLIANGYNNPFFSMARLKSPHCMKFAFPRSLIKQINWWKKWGSSVYWDHIQIMMLIILYLQLYLVLVVSIKIFLSLKQNNFTFIVIIEKNYHSSWIRWIYKKVIITPHGYNTIFIISNETCMLDIIYIYYLSLIRDN